MNKINEMLLRRYLKPTVESDLPGRLRLSFSKYNLLPKEAEPYLHYLKDVFNMFPGVSNAEINTRIGTILIHYDPKITTARAILHWVEAVADECIRISKEVVWEGANEHDLEVLVRRRLERRLGIAE